MADKKTQREKFEEAARHLETDDSEEHFDRIVKQIANWLNCKPPRAAPARSRLFCYQSLSEFPDPSGSFTSHPR